MGLQEVASWYQRKIGTYDKQQWERTVEQRILHGLTHVPRKTAKLKTELIDVDLVRGSSFPKAKPKHGLSTVARLGIQRLLLLPFYWQWWVQQTSPRVYYLLLLLYCLQIFNFGLYYHCTHINPDDTADNVSSSELFVPTFMMVVLSIIHSQIVCTHNVQSSEFHERSHRRVKRTKRRPLPQNRIRTIGPDSKSAPDMDSEKRVNLGDVGGKYGNRLRTRSSVGEDKRACNRSSPISNVPEVGSDTTPRIKVCFKEPTSKENIPPQGLDDNQRVREGTPMDDDGFESLNGNGSSENGDEPVEDNLKSLNVKIDSVEKSKKYSDLYLKCPEQINFQPGNTQETDKVGLNSKIISFKTSTCDDNITSSSIDRLDNKSYKYRKFTSRRDVLKEKKGEKGTEGRVSALHRADLNASVSSEIEWLNENVQKEDYNRSCNDVGKILARVHVLQRRQSAPLPRLRQTDNSSDHRDSDSEDPLTKSKASLRRDSLLKRRRGSQNLLLTCPQTHADESSYNSSCCDESEEGGDDEALSSPGTGGSCCGNPNLTEGGTTSATEWMGVTTNSEECSYSSDMDESDTHAAPTEFNDHPFAWEFEQSPTVILSPSCAASDKVSCTMWESRDVKKADLSVLDISSAIIARVEAMPENMDYFYIGMVMALLLSLVPPFCRMILASTAETHLASLQESGNASLPLSTLELSTMAEHASEIITHVINYAFGSSLWERTVMIIALLERFALAELFFFLLAVAERTFKQRFLYAKLFSHLTSFRRARKSELPHFRLNKVRNIKTWLSVRSYLRKRGPQRSVDMLVSAAFIITLLLLTFLIVELLKDSVRLNSQYNMEALCWCLALGVFLLRFMTLGTDINRKYCNLSVLITEQINLYLQIEQKPNKKEELMVANSVLKLAADLLKELESPFKISGLSANPYLYNITNVVILSALSGVLSEILGFKLKLHKIKIK